MRDKCILSSHLFDGTVCRVDTKTLFHMGGFALYIRMISFGRPIAKQIFNMFHTPYGVEYSIDMTVFVHYNFTGNLEWRQLNAECLDI